MKWEDLPVSMIFIDYLPLSGTATGIRPDREKDLGGNMPGGRGKPRRACGICKAYKYMGNAPERYPVREADKRNQMKKEIRDSKNSND